MRYVLTPRARDGLLRILLDVSDRFGAAQAERTLRRLSSAFDRISRNPGIGHPRPDIAGKRDVRFWVVAPSVIAYRETTHVIEILFVERGERNWLALLGEPDS